MTRRAQNPDQPALLAVEQEQPKPTAGDLVAAWCAGYSKARADKPPHTALVRRVAGICRSVAKDCDTIEDWRTAWRACLAAGRAGRFDVVPFLADEQPRSLVQVKGTQSAREAVIARLQQGAMPGETIREIGL